MKRAGFINNDELRKDAFWKGLKIIQSCENKTQLIGAKNYTTTLNLVFEDNIQSGMQYDVLLVALKEKKLKLKI